MLAEKQRLFFWSYAARFLVTVMAFAVVQQMRLVPAGYARYSPGPPLFELYLGMIVFVRVPANLVWTVYVLVSRRLRVTLR